MTTAQRSLFHLAYTSQRAPDVTDDDVVDGIVLPAMAKNRRLDITGCLWFGPDRFLQVIEGEEAVIRDLYEAIRIDTRHHSIDTLAAESITARNFERFNMRAIGDDAPQSVRDLLHQAGVRQAMLTKSPSRRKAENPSAIAEFETLVKRVIRDLAAWPMNLDERGSQPGFA